MTNYSTARQDAFCLFISAQVDGTADVIRTLERNEVNMIEIGIPFSDPMADGSVIQDAAVKALRNGMSLRKLFSQLKDIRSDVGIPLILMGCPTCRSETTSMNTSPSQIASICE